MTVAEGKVRCLRALTDIHSYPCLLVRLMLPLLQVFDDSCMEPIKLTLYVPEKSSWPLFTPSAFFLFLRWTTGLVELSTDWTPFTILMLQDCTVKRYRDNPIEISCFGSTMIFKNPDMQEAQQLFVFSQADGVIELLRANAQRAAQRASQPRGDAATGIRAPVDGEFGYDWRFDLKTSHWGLSVSTIHEVFTVDKALERIRSTPGSEVQGEHRVLVVLQPRVSQAHHCCPGIILGEVSRLSFDAQISPLVMRCGQCNSRWGDDGRCSKNCQDAR
jgi:hypothetical protein